MHTLRVIYFISNIPIFLLIKLPPSIFFPPLFEMFFSNKELNENWTEFSKYISNSKKSNKCNHSTVLNL